MKILIILIINTLFTKTCLSLATDVWSEIDKKDIAIFKFGSSEFNKNFETIKDLQRRKLNLVYPHVIIDSSIGHLHTFCLFFVEN